MPDLNIIVRSSYFIVPPYKMFYFQMRVFETIITVSSGHSALYHVFLKSINLPLTLIEANESVFITMLLLLF